MRRVLCVLALLGCSSEDLGRQEQPLESQDPADYPLTLPQAEAAIRAHAGDGCLRLFPLVECQGCAPRYRLESIATDAAVSGCGRSTFVSGQTVTTANAPTRATYAWTCQGGALGGDWLEATTSLARTGAIVCRP